MLIRAHVSPRLQGKAMATSSHFDARLTYDDLARMPDDGMRHEIIDGVHYVARAPFPTFSRSRLMRRPSRHRYCLASAAPSTNCSVRKEKPAASKRKGAGLKSRPYV